MFARLFCWTVATAVMTAPAMAEDGYDLWLRHEKVQDGGKMARHATAVVAPGRGATALAARDENTNVCVDERVVVYLPARHQIVL